MLFVDACVRENSRTRALVKKVLGENVYETVELEKENILPMNNETLKLRDSLIAKGEFENPLFKYANQFKNAETIVIAAPYWDLLFPASLRAYIEQICVSGITFRYSEQGFPVSLPKQRSLFT